MGDFAIKVDSVTKIYKLYEKPTDRLKESLSPFRKTYHSMFYALNNVSFIINKGETVGIIGKNGSGKSTLLKMITGVLTPSYGTIDVRGHISALLELGAGFNPDYTGIENIYLNGTIMGYSKEEIDGKIDDILSFADIGDFVYQPVKVYSSGMFVRLAFAVAINVDPDILIVDEALSVGDMRFQQKCYRKIEEFKETKTVLFVSHDLSVINKYCDRAIWLDAGRVLDDNLPEVVAKKYQAFMMGSFLNKTNNSSNNEVSNLKEKRINVRPLSENLDVFGDSKAVITGVDLKDLQKDESISIVTQGQEVKLLINVRANELIGNPIIGFSIKDRLGSTITESNSSVLAGEIEPLFPEKDYTFAFYFTFPPLLRGEYTISTAVASGTMEDHVQHCWVHDALIVQMFDSQKYQLSGILSLKDAVFYQLE